MCREKSALFGVLVLLGVSLSACTTTRTMLAPHPPAQYTSLGAARGEGCSSVVPLFSFFQAVPVHMADRFQRAYAAAVASVPGATALIDVTFQEHWYWAVYGTVYCTIIAGEGVR